MPSSEQLNRGYEEEDKEPKIKVYHLRDGKKEEYPVDLHHWKKDDNHLNLSFSVVERSGQPTPEQGFLFENVGGQVTNTHLEYEVEQDYPKEADYRNAIKVRFDGTAQCPLTVWVSIDPSALGEYDRFRYAACDFQAILRLTFANLEKVEMYIFFTVNWPQYRKKASR